MKGTKRTLKSKPFKDKTIGFKSRVDQWMYFRNKSISFKKIRSGTRYVNCYSGFDVGFVDGVSISKRVEYYLTERDQLGDKGGICSLSSMSLNSIQKIKPLKSIIYYKGEK